MRRWLFGALLAVSVASTAHAAPMEWFDLAKMTSTTAFDRFGACVALSGTTMVIGAPERGTDGVAEIYRFNVSPPALETTLTVTDGGGRFGRAVAIDGDIAAVTSTNGNSRGAVYVFVRTGTTWEKQARLTPSDAADLDEFGYHVAIAGKTILAGARVKKNNQGAAYVYTQSGTTWTEQKLLPTDLGLQDRFGESVAIDKDTLVVGAPQHNSNRGVLYVYARTGATWTQQTKLVHSGGADRYIGEAVALHGDTVVGGGPSLFNSAFVFFRTGTTWAQQANLDAPMPINRYSAAIALHGDVALVSDPSVNSGKGVVHTFLRSGTTWTTGPVLSDVTAPTNEQYGDTLAFDGTHALIGARNGGLAFLKRYARATGDTCSAATECAPGKFCADGVCCESACTDKCSACDNAGSLGKCTPVLGKPHGTRTCGGEGACAALCDNTGACAFPDDKTACGPCSEARIPRCDGKGACASAIVCDASLGCEDDTRCRSTCATNEHCAKGFNCVTGRCLPSAENVCSADGQSSEPRGGTPIPCAPYACDLSSGRCRTDCTVTADCAGGLVCDPTAKTCAAPPAFTRSRP